MTQFTEYGYSRVRNYMSTEFKSIAVYDGSTEVKRVDNPTVNVTGNNVSFTIALDNVDGSLTSKKINAIKLLESSTSTDAIAEGTFADYTFESVDDKASFTLTITVPTIV